MEAGARGRVDAALRFCRFSSCVQSRRTRKPEHLRIGFEDQNVTRHLA